MFKLKSKIKYLLGALIAFMFKINFGATQSDDSVVLFRGSAAPLYGAPSPVSRYTSLAFGIIGLIGLIIGIVIYIKSKKK